MTLIEYRDITQGSQEWHDVRRGLVTASTVGRLLTARTRKPAANDGTRTLLSLLVTERITGWTDPTYTSDDMWNGHECEPHARNAYSQHHSPVVEMGFMVRQWDRCQLGYSPDGLVGDVGQVEIKCPRSKEHLRTILDDEVPARYVPQLQAGLFVSGRKWADFVSHVGGMPLYVKRVYPDLDYFATIVAAVQKFEDNAAEMVAEYRTATQGLPATERVPDLELVF